MNFRSKREDEAKMVWIFYYQENMSRGATRITDLDKEEMLCPINMDMHRKYNIWKRKRRENLTSLKTQKGGLGKS